MVNVLELFSGTGSVSKECKSRGYHVTTLDILPHNDSDKHYQCDIMTWDYKIYNPGHFDLIWASPPCTEYSSIRAISKKPRNLVQADNFVQRTIDIILWLKPKYYIIENPQTGILKSRLMMNDLHYDDVDYCHYGFPYRKRTRLWNNIELNLKMCKYDCSVSDHVLRQHNNHVIKSLHTKDIPRGKLNTSALASIPTKLVQSILNQLPFWRNIILKLKLVRK
jgi:site-specific DNA-cytosine methylase